MKIIKNLNEINEGLTIVDFFANWCMPCKMLSPELEKLKEKMPEIEIYKVNVDESMEIAKEFDVYSIPALFLFKDKKVISKSIGFKSVDELMKWVEENK